MPLAAGAATSQLTQSINPIQCTYTVFTTGTTTLTPTQCSNQLVPTLSSVTTTLTPRLIGTYTAMQTSNLRVWVGEDWFTLGVSSALTVNSDIWTLDLANTSFVLAPSTTYTVIIEATTVNGYVLSSVYVDILTTQAAPATINSPTPAPLLRPTPPRSPMRAAPIPIDLVAPLSQPGMSRYYYGSNMGTIKYRIDDNRSSAHQSVIYWTVILVAILIVLARIVYLARKRRQRR